MRKSFNDSNPIYGDIGQAEITDSILSIKAYNVLKTKQVFFGRNAMSWRSFDFTPFYDSNIDAVTNACQQAIEIMLEETTRERSTIGCYCHNGLKKFLSFCKLRAAALNRPLQLDDIDETLIKNFIRYLADIKIGRTSQYNIYMYTKNVLRKLSQLKCIDENIYPRNPYPNIKRNYKGEKALSNSERRRFVETLKEELRNILRSDMPMCSDELVLCMLAIALRSGINPTPLRELQVNCIQPHPIKSDRLLLVSYKRRGNATHIQSLRYSKDIELMKTVMPDVVEIIEAVVRRNQCYRDQSEDMKYDLFVFKPKNNFCNGHITRISSSTIHSCVRKWILKWKLQDDNGQLLVLNIMRLRKTFENRLWQLSGQDPWVTAKLAGHTVKVSNDHYLEAPVEAEKNFRLMGEIRAQELLEPSDVNSSAKNTPVSKCHDVINGQFAPNANNEPCTNFLACVRCRSFVVTEEDLHRLFSFYWLVIYEREFIGARKWSRYFSHIIRIIDSEVVPRFDEKMVMQIKNTTKTTPHPFWKNREQLALGITT